MQHCGEVPREFFMHRLILLLSYHTVLWVSQSLSLSSTHFKEWYSSSSALDIYNLHSRTLPACSATSFPDGVSILVSCQVVLCRVWSKRVGVLIIWVLTAVIGSGLSSESYASIVICVYGFAKVDGILQLFLKHLLTGIPGQLEERSMCRILGGSDQEGCIYPRPGWQSLCPGSQQWSWAALSCPTQSEERGSVPC